MTTWTVAQDGPIVELNRAVAIGFRDGPEAGLAAVTPLRGGALAHGLQAVADAGSHHVVHESGHEHRA